MPETDPPQGRQLAERLRTSLRRLTIRHREQTLQVTASFGVAAWDAIATGSLPVENVLNSLLERADNALYTAKSQGRNRTCVG